jgi:hypothetical protein
MNEEAYAAASKLTYYRFIELAPDDPYGMKLPDKLAA